MQKMSTKSNTTESNTNNATDSSSQGTMSIQPVETGVTSSLDETRYVPKAGQGVTLIEQSAPKQVPRENKVLVRARRAQLMLNDSDWDLSKMLSRNNLIATIPWALTDVPGALLATYDVPLDLLTQQINASPFQRFQNWDCNFIRIRAQITASRYHQGRALVVFQPTCRHKTGIEDYVSTTNAWALQHLVLDPSNASAGELIIDFTHPKGFLNLLENDSLGQLYVIVFNQLKAVTGASTSVDVKLFYSVDGAHFRIPRAAGAPPPFRASVQSGIVKAFEDIVDEIIPDNLVGDIISTVLDKPSMPIPADWINHKTLGPLSSFTGPEYVEKLQAYSKGQTLCDEEHFGSSSLMKDFFFTRKWSYVSTETWSTSDPTGRVLASWNVGPMDYATDHVTTDPFDPSPFDYPAIANNYMYWRGGIIYAFDIVASQFQEGRLDVIYHPNGLDASTDYASNMSQYAASFSIRNGINSFAVLCPYLADTPWRRVYNGAQLADTPTDGLYRYQDFFSGTLKLVVSNNLRAPETVVPNVEINVFKYGDVDFEYSFPHMVNSSIVPVFLPFRKSYRTVKQSGRSNEIPIVDFAMPTKNVKPTRLAGPGGRTGDPHVPHFGERYGDMQEVCKRFMPFDTINVPLAPHTGDTSQNISTTIQVGSLLTGANHSLTKKLLPFRLFRGGLRFKVIPTVWFGDASTYPPPPFLYGHINYYPYNDGILGGNVTTWAGTNQFDDSNPFPRRSCNAPLVHFNQNHFPEFEIPFLSHYSTQLLKSPNDKPVPEGLQDLFYQGSLQFTCYIPSIKFQAAKASYLMYQIYIAFADETQVGLFMGIPSMAHSFATGGARWWPDWWAEGEFRKKEDDEYELVRRPLRKSVK